MDYEIGDRICYSPFGGGTRTVICTGREIHNGRPSFDGKLIQPDPDGYDDVWGYDDQILYTSSRKGL